MYATMPGQFTVVHTTGMAEEGIGSSGAGVQVVSCVTRVLGPTLESPGRA